MTERKKLLLRLDPAVHDALARWADDELRSTTAQIEYLLRLSLAQAGRLPGNVGGMPRRGRPPKDATASSDTDSSGTVPSDAAPPTTVDQLLTDPSDDQDAQTDISP